MLSFAKRKAHAGPSVIPLDKGKTSEQVDAATTPSSVAEALLEGSLTEDALKGLSGDAHQQARDLLIQGILSRDKEIFELKRQHELSMLRVEQHQRRMLKDQEDRGMYYEQNVNVHTFDTISVGLHSQRSTLYHTMSAERLRNFKMFLSVIVTIVSCAYLYYRYMINPAWEYVEEPIKVIGSRVNLVREERWRRMNDEEQLAELQRLEDSYKEGRMKQ